MLLNLKQTAPKTKVDLGGKQRISAAEANTSDTTGHIPGWPGHGLGRIVYSCNFLKGVGFNIPMLLCCASMRASNFVLDFMNDCLHIAMQGGRMRPRDKRVFVRVPLIWTGTHYLLPTDNEVEVAAEKVFLTLDHEGDQERLTIETLQGGWR